MEYRQPRLLRRVETPRRDRARLAGRRLAAALAIDVERIDPELGVYALRQLLADPRHDREAILGRDLPRMSARLRARATTR
jgi:hypothetical protein